MRARLAHVLWIGGGPQAGKTTLSRLLAGKWDLKIYNLDWHAVRDHDRRDGAAGAAFAPLARHARGRVPRQLATRARALPVGGGGLPRPREPARAAPCAHARRRR